MRRYDEVDEVIDDIRARKLGVKSAADRARAAMGSDEPPAGPRPNGPTLTRKPNRAERRHPLPDREGALFLLGRAMANRPVRTRHRQGELVRAVNVPRIRVALCEPLDPRRHLDQAVNAARAYGDLGDQLVAAGYAPHGPRNRKIDEARRAWKASA